MAPRDPQADAGEEYFAAFNDLAKRCPQLAQDILGRLLDSVVRLNSRIIREIIAMALLVFIFELLNRNLIGTASAFGLEIARLGFMRYWIPAAIAALFFHITTTMRDRNFNMNMIRGICAWTYPELEKSSMLRIITPAGQLLTSSNPPRELIQQRSMFYRNSAQNLELITLFIVMPIGFNIYSIVQLFRHSKPPHVASIIVMILTTVILAAAYTIFAISGAETKIPRPASGSGPAASRAHEDSPSQQVPDGDCPPPQKNRPRAKPSGTEVGRSGDGGP
jgi:hypothetical protein